MYALNGYILRVTHADMMSYESNSDVLRCNPNPSGPLAPDAVVSTFSSSYRDIDDEDDERSRRVTTKPASVGLRRVLSEVGLPSPISCCTAVFR